MIPRRATLTRLGGLAALSLLVGCGFQPVYMPTASDEAGVAQREMGAVFVESLGERSGQLLRHYVTGLALFDTAAS